MPFIPTIEKCYHFLRPHGGGYSKILWKLCVGFVLIPTSVIGLVWFLEDPFHFLAMKFIENEMWFLIAGLVNLTWDQSIGPISWCCLRCVEWVHCLFLFPPCFRKDVVVACKIGSFLCSLDNLLQKNIIVFFLGNQISKWRSFEKGLFLIYFSHFLVTRVKLQ